MVEGVGVIGTDGDQSITFWPRNGHKPTTKGCSCAFRQRQPHVDNALFAQVGQEQAFLDCPIPSRE